MNQENVETILNHIDNNEPVTTSGLNLEREEVGDALSYIKKNKLAEDILLRKVEDTYTMMDASTAYLTPKGKEHITDHE
ncbi:hypothetical protein ERX27_03920 [Macrococcus brunensis]|uniref:Uncharacterized protein n=1 Tax=Macrococcus brunensis TaxID=198483 RepID=A0A4R6BEZ3_9STAP|nr:hypothetical protein [Macrococcus brunensis]TDL98293.1 hypothetical protein ERX27_03920 [Macrococcus brunensis]